MATTTNYGWTTPDDTALVSAGASAMRTLGSAIDTTLGGLKGIKQIVTASYSTNASSSSATYADTGLTANITCSTTSSKVLAIVVMAGCAKDSSNTALGLKLLRGATALVTNDNIAITGSTARNGVGNQTLMYLDSPASTSALTYKVQLASSSGTASSQINWGGTSGASQIFLIELER